jgi:hypothetical protein
MKEGAITTNGKRHIINLGKRQNWNVMVEKNEEEMDDFGGNLFNIYFTAKISPNCKIKPDPNGFTRKMKELEWEREKGSIFIRKKRSLKEVELALEEIKIVILSIEKTKRMLHEIKIDDLFHHIRKSLRSPHSPEILEDHRMTQSGREIVEQLNNFSRQIATKYSSFNKVVCC